MIRPWLERYRLLTGPLRVLPDFIIIGAQKGGTTSLTNYLAEHPCVGRASQKEVHYFDLNFDRPPEWYRAHFPLQLGRGAARAARPRGWMAGESSPYYLFHPHAPRRAARLLPRVKLIAVLRNPVDRAYSHYQHMVKKGREPLSFEAAIEAEADRVCAELERLQADEGYVSPSHRHFSYLSRGAYVDQLKNWFGHFDREQVLILKSEDLFQRPAETFGRVVDFLGLPLAQGIRFPKLNAGRYEPMQPETRRRLARLFVPHNRRLYEFLGIDFGW